MLVLTRKVGQGIVIVIGDDIKIIIKKIHGNYVQLGFKCDSSIPIYREELLDKEYKEIASTSHEEMSNIKITKEL